MWAIFKNGTLVLSAYETCIILAILLEHSNIHRYDLKYSFFCGGHIFSNRHQWVKNRFISLLPIFSRIVKKIVFSPTINYLKYIFHTNAYSV